MPLLDLFWTTLFIFAWVLWFMLLFRVYGDLFARQDIGGWAKTGWVVLTLVMPFLGVFVYLISQGRGMAERAVAALEHQRAASDAYVRSVAANAQAEQMAKARDLLQSGAITPEEYERMVPSQRTGTSPSTPAPSPSAPAPSVPTPAPSAPAPSVHS